MSRQRYNEIIDRVCYMYMEANGEINFPNSFEGDLLKIAYENAVQAVKKPELNKNQKQVFEWLKVGYCSKDSLFEALKRIGEAYEDPKTEEAYYSLSVTEEAQVVQAFTDWFLEQGEHND